MLAPAKSSAFDEYLALILRLNQLIRDGLADSDESDSLRESMDDPWDRMTEEEAKLMRAISADLFTIWDEKLYPHPRDLSIFDSSLAERARQANAAGDSLRVLELLRINPHLISAHRAALLRGICYEDLHVPQLAIKFYERAFELEEKPGTGAFKLLSSLNRSEDAQRGLAIAIALAKQHANCRSEVLLLVAQTLADAAIGEVDATARNYCALARDCINDALDRAKGSMRSTVELSAFASQVLILVPAVHLQLGDRKTAVELISRVLEIAPDAWAYCIRAFAWGMENWSAAIADFKEAVSRGIEFELPYRILAHTALIDGDWKNCIELARQALRRTSDVVDRSELHEWIGIGLAELGAPLDTVRFQFQEAIESNPSNQSARANLRISEQFLDGRAEQVAAWSIDKSPVTRPFQLPANSLNLSGPVELTLSIP